MEIIDIEPGDARLTDDLLPVLRELRPGLGADDYRAVYDEGYGQGLRFTAAYSDGRCVGVAGWRTVANTNRRRMLYVDDLVTASESRSTGVGRALLEYLEERGRDLGCNAIHLDSGTHRRDAHRFYMRERLTIVAFHFALELDAQTGAARRLLGLRTCQCTSSRTGPGPLSSRSTAGPPTTAS